MFLGFFYLQNCPFFSIASDEPHEHKLVKRQDDDSETVDRRRLKTKFVNGVEVVVRGKHFLKKTRLA